MGYLLGANLFDTHIMPMAMAMAMDTTNTEGFRATLFCMRVALGGRGWGGDNKLIKKQTLRNIKNYLYSIYNNMQTTVKQTFVIFFRHI